MHEDSSIKPFRIFEFCPACVLAWQASRYSMGLSRPQTLDTYVYAHQYSYTGTATDTPLMRWLSDYTFPRESKMQDLEVAEKLYSQLVQRLLLNGTTTALYFASLHLAPSLLLARICEEAGQRAFIGKVCLYIVRLKTYLSVLT